VSLRFYMDVHVRSAVTNGLRQRGVDVLTAREDGRHTLEDPALLDRATELGRVLFSQDYDLLSEATRRQRAGIPFAGIVYGHQLRLTDGNVIEDLTLMAEVYESTDIDGRVEFLPL